MEKKWLEFISEQSCNSGGIYSLKFKSLRDFNVHAMQDDRSSANQQGLYFLEYLRYPAYCHIRFMIKNIVK